MLETIERLAEVSVARGCGFAALGIVTLMVGLADQLYLAFQAGGLLTLGMAAILWVWGKGAVATSYKRTELWIMLDANDRPKPEIAQQVIGTVLRDVYLRFALCTGVLAAVMLALSVLLRWWSA